MSWPISMPMLKASRLCQRFGASRRSISLNTKENPSPWSSPSSAVTTVVVRCPAPVSATVAA